MNKNQVSHSTLNNNPKPPQYLTIAAEILELPSVDDIPKDITLKLYRLNTLISHAGGNLCSRQVVAMVILFLEN